MNEFRKIQIKKEREKEREERDKHHEPVNRYIKQIRRHYIQLERRRGYILAMLTVPGDIKSKPIEPQKKKYNLKLDFFIHRFDLSVRRVL